MKFKLLYFSLVLLLAPLIVTFTHEGVRFLIAVFAFDSLKWFLLGTFLALVAYLILRKGENTFLQVLMHEMEHAAIRFLFTGRWPSKMEIEPPEGLTASTNGCFLLWVTPLAPLAPYFLPLLTIPFLVLKAAAALAFSLLEIPFPSFLATALDLLIGATLMLHLAWTVKEFQPSVQMDIKNSGLIVSIVTVAFLIVMSVVLSVAVVTSSYAEFWASVKTASAAGLDLYQIILDWLKVHLPQVLDALRQAVKDLL
jgi:hypothetical protein